MGRPGRRLMGGRRCRWWVLVSRGLWGRVWGEWMVEVVWIVVVWSWSIISRRRRRIMRLVAGGCALSWLLLRGSWLVSFFWLCLLELLLGLNYLRERCGQCSLQNQG